MLKRTPALAATEPGTPQRAPEGVDPAVVIAFARRNWGLIAGCVITTTLIGLIYLLVTPPIYFAQTNLLLDTRKLQLFQQQSVMADPTYDFAGVDSQIEVVKSEAIAEAVVDDLKLYADPEFTGASTSLLGSLSSALLEVLDTVPGGDLKTVTRSEDDRRSAAKGYLTGNLQVQRLRQTYVLQIGFRSRDPGKAAAIANAIGEAYILDQTTSKQYITKRAADWLQDRMIELRTRAVKADQEVQAFRTANNLIKVGAGSMSEQQLGELSSTALKAREEAAQAKAKLDRVEALIRSDTPDVGMTAWIPNDVLSRLRSQWVDLTRKVNDYAVNLGPDHLAVINLRKEIKQIEQAAAGELRRIAEGFRNEYEVAQSRQKSAEAMLAESTNQNASLRQENGALQALESSARAYQILHDSFLQRYVEASQQQTVTATEARVLTPASSGSKILRQRNVVLGAALALGLALGSGVAYARERLDRVFRTPNEVERALGIECLGVLPAIDGRTGRKSGSKPQSDGSQGRIMDEDLGILRQVIRTPFSRFAETLRRVKVAADNSSIAGDVRVIGIVSAVPVEGKSTVAANLAQLTAHGSGGQVLLIDADLRNPSLTRAMAPHATAGLLEVLADTAKYEDVVWTDPITELRFLPAVLKGSIANTSEILASRRMADLLHNVRSQYDYIVIDFPPLAPVVDAKAAAQLLDGFLLVIEWGQTPPDAILEVLGSAEVIRSKLVGAVLNRANPRAMKKLESYKGKNYHQYYESYLSDH